MAVKVVTYDDIAQVVGLYDETIDGAAVAIQNVLDFNTVTTTTSQVTSGATVTSIAVNAVDFSLVTKGKKVTLYHPGTTEFPSKQQEFTAAQDYLAGDTTISVESDTADHTFPLGSFILILGSQQQKYLAYTERAIELGVKTWNNIVDQDGELLVDHNGDPILGVTGNKDGQLSYLVSQISIMQDEIELKVSAGEVYAAINLGVLVNDLGELESFATMVADVINLNGLVTVTNFDEAEALKRWVFNQNDAPTERPNTMPLQSGDLWWDLDGGNMPYLWNGTAWVLAATQIDGASITTGYINAARIQAGTIDATKLTTTEISAFFAELANVSITGELLMATGGKILVDQLIIDENGISFSSINGYTNDSSQLIWYDENQNPVLLIAAETISSITKCLFSSQYPDSYFDFIIGDYGRIRFNDSEISIRTKLGRIGTLEGGGQEDFYGFNSATPTYWNIVFNNNLDPVVEAIVVSKTKVTVPLEIEIDGALNHDGSTAGFFGTTPTTKATALTAPNASALNTGDATSDTVIGNMRTRINELETKLQAYGLLA